MKATAVMAALVLASFAALAAAAPVGVDWRYTFSRVTLDPFMIETFTNPPWAVILLPHAALPLPAGNAINLLLNVTLLGAVAWRHGGRWPGLALAFTSPVFFDLARVNNIEWMICMGLLLPARWGAILLALKPHVAGGAALVWARRHGLAVFVPLALVSVASLLLWGWWPARLAGLPPGAPGWNLAPWPVGVVPGLWLLWQAMRDDDEDLAAAATPLLVPYVAAYSLAVTVALLAGRHRRAAAALWLALWWFVVVEVRRF